MRRLPRLAAACLALLACAAPAEAQRRDTGFDLVRLDASPRAAAAGSVALPGDDPALAFYNPALLGEDMHRTVAVGLANHVADVRAGTALYVRHVPRAGLTLAAGVRSLSYGSFDRAAPSGGEPEAGTFGAGEAGFTLAAAREVAPRVRAGASLHALTARIDDARAAALAADLGLTYTVPSERLVVGASLHHVGRVLSSLGDTSDRLPSDLRLTVSKGLLYLPLTVTVAGYDLAGVDGAASDSSVVRRALDHLAVGGELRLGRALAVRAGLQPRRASDLRSGARIDLAGVSAGFGLRLARVGVDYAYVGWGEAGGVHQFGLRTRL